MGIFSLNGLFGQSNTNSNYLTLEWSDVKDRIYPMLKQSLPETDPTPSIELKENERPVTDNFTVDIHIVYLIDFNNHFTYINFAHLTKWSISKEYLRQTALSNLDQLANEHAKFHGDSEYALITLDGNFEASLVLSDMFWPHIQQITESANLVIGIPTRDVLVVSYLENEQGIEKLRQAVKGTFPNGDHSVSKWLYLRSNDKWIEYEYVE